MRSPAKLILHVGLVAAFVHPVLSATPTSLETAERYFDEGRWEEALTAFEFLTEENPYQGRLWWKKGQVLYQLKRYEEAIEAYLEANRLGHWPKWTAASLGFCYKALGEVEQSAHWFARSTSIDPSMMEELPRYSKTSLRTFLGAERAAVVFGPEADPDGSRVDRWRTDLAFLRDVLVRSHFDYDVRTSAEIWESRFAELYERIPDLEDHAIALELGRFAALAGDGHTNIWPQFSDGFSFLMLPLLLYPFEDGIFVRAAPPEYADLVGARLVSLGGVPTETLIEGASAFHGHDNPMHTLLQLPFILSTLEVLTLQGAATSVGGVEIAVQKPTEALVSRFVEARPWKETFPEAFGAKLDASAWVRMNDGAEAPTPLWLRQPQDIYWFEELEDEGIIYFHYDQIHDKPDLPFEAFVERLFALVRTKPGTAMVIDLRMNDGGSSALYPPLVKQVLTHPEINQHGRLFTIIGRMTYSAAMNLAVDLEHWTETLFVGEPTGSSPNFIGENKSFTLPNSGLRVSVSDRYHQRAGSTDKRIWIAPDLVAEMTSGDFARNHDPALEAIREFLAERRSERE